MTKRQAPVEVDVLPAQADGLASAHAGGQHQVVEVREPVVGDVLQELLALLRSPRLGFLGVLWCELDVLGRVVQDQAAFDGRVEG